MKIKEKYKSLPVKQRAAILTASIILGFIAFFHHTNNYRVAASSTYPYYVSLPDV